MDNFWGGVTLLTIIALGLIFYTTAAQTEIEIRDLETECKEDKTTQHNVRLNYDNTLTFTGQYPVKSPLSTLDTSYSHQRDTITLNIQTVQDIPPRSDYHEDCNAIAVYHINTKQMEGRKDIKLQHNGKTVEKQTINIR